MMRRRVVIPALLLASLATLSSRGFAQYGDAKSPPVVDASQRFSASQLDNLAGPVALYPDALLAQVLVASTFPDQIQDAADFVKAYGTDSVDVQSWDVSVKAVAHYPSVLNTMADKIDWTSALGKAYATQSSDVMASVQRLRRMAADQGNLNSTPQANVVRASESIQIVPVEPRVIYVPVYDPYVIYSRPIFSVGYSSRYWSWGIGFPIGSWLIYDCDWGLRRVYYNGWSPSYYAFGGGWRQRSRPFIQVTNIYINPRYNNVYVNRNVHLRSVNYYNVDRYASVHNGRYFDNRRDGRYDARDDSRPTNRYAVRNDGNNGNGGEAVRGGGYRNGNQSVINTGNGGNRPNTARDGSGYGGRNDVNRAGTTGNGNGNTDVARDGNGNRIRQANPRGTPPQIRRSEPAARSERQPVMAMPRRSEPAQPQTQQSPATPQRRAATPRQSAPEQRRAEPSRSTQQPQMSRPQSSRDSRGSDSRASSGSRSARPRGEKN